MSNEIDKKLWCIQEKALKLSASSQSSEEQAAVKEYQELYQMLGQLPEDEPPFVLAQNVTSKIAKRHRKQFAGKLLAAGLCLLLIIGLVVGLILLLPQSVLLTQVGEAMQLPLVLVSIAVFGFVGHLIKKLVI